MARAQQAKWFADAVLSYAQGSRSWEAATLAAGAAVQAGTIGVFDPVARAVTVPPTLANVNCLIMDSIPARTAAMPVLVLARDAEVNDAYIVYGALGAAAVNGALLNNANIVVRAGVLPQSIVSPSMLDEEGRMIEGTEGPHEPEPAAV
jgi:hypothetical protein